MWMMKIYYRQVAIRRNYCRLFSFFVKRGFHLNFGAFFVEIFKYRKCFARLQHGSMETRQKEE